MKCKECTNYYMDGHGDDSTQMCDSCIERNQVEW